MKYRNKTERMTPSLKIDGKPKDNYNLGSLSEEDKVIDFVKFNQAVEGFEMTVESEDRCRKIFRGEMTADEAIKEILKKHGIERNK